MWFWRTKVPRNILSLIPPVRGEEARVIFELKSTVDGLEYPHIRSLYRSQKYVGRYIYQ